MSDIPYRERGYSIEPDSLIVHERYQDHAPRAMRTSAAGVGEYAKGREPIACEVCFPAPKPAKAKGKREDGGTISRAQDVAVRGTETFVPASAGEIIPRPRGLGGDDSTAGSGDPPMRGE